MAGAQQDEGVGHQGVIGAFAGPSTAIVSPDGLPGNRSMGLDHVSVSDDL